MEALETGRVYRGHFNVKNHGLITNLPEDAIVEVPGFVDRFGLNMVAGLTLPDACAALCLAAINVQRLSVKAAMAGNVGLLKLAMLNDPLVGAVCTTDEVWQMVDELLVAQAKWLPQYTSADIEAAEERLATAPARVTRVGVSRLPVRSVAELRTARRTGNEIAVVDDPVVA